VQVVLRASTRVLDAVRLRYGAFEAAADDADVASVSPSLSASSLPPSIELHVRERAVFEPTLERESDATLTLDASSAVTLLGTAEGRFELATRTGQLDGVAGLGPIDSMLRAALSLVLPEAGALLLHGALVPGADGTATVFVGRSGAGKSTVARAFGAACDELVVVRPVGDLLRVSATPYWQGRPFEAVCRTLVCLERGTPRVAPVRGAEAARLLARHVVRYVAWPPAERAILACVAAAVGRTAMIDAVCPTGSAFLPFLERALDLSRVAA
jgi:hypothetical protein